MEHIDRKIDIALPSIVTAVMSPKPMVVATLKQYHTLSIGVLCSAQLSIHQCLHLQILLCMLSKLKCSCPFKYNFYQPSFFISSPPAFYNKIISILRITVNIFSEIKQSNFCQSFCIDFHKTGEKLLYKENTVSAKC